MKRLLIWVAMIMLGCNLTNAQKITKHEVDRFTKATVTETSAVKLFSHIGTYRAYMVECSMRKYNGLYVMPTKLVFDGMSVHKFTECDGIYLLLENDESIFLQTSYTGLTNKGTFSTVFNLTSKDVESLRTNKVVAVRISYLGGYYDHDVKEKDQGKIMEMIDLVDSVN